MALSEEECSTAKSRSSSSSALSSSNAGAGGSGNHYLAKCVVRGSVVLHVVYGRIRSPNSFDMVFGKETSLELVVIGEDGILQSVSDQPVFGTIKDLAILPWKDDFFQSSPEMVGRDFILVLSDSGKLSVLSFCNEMHRFFPVTQVQLSSPGNSRDQLGRLLTVDSSGSFIAMGAYENQLAMLSVSAAGGNDIIDKKLVYPPESEEDTIRPRSTQENSINGTIWSMSFVTRDISQPSNEHNPVLAVILNRKKALHNELLILEWNFRDHAVSVISQYVEPGALACDIVEVPHSCGFAIIFRVGDALVMDLRDPHKPCCVYRTNLNFLAHAVEEPNSVEEPCKAQQDVDDDGLFNVAACALLELREYDPMCIDSDSGITSISHKHACSWSWQPGSVKDPRLIFCLDTGEFFLLEFCFDSGSIKVSQSDCLYKGLPCKSLLWVKDGFLACLVEMGDGMVLKLEGERITYSSPIQNIAPILDMSIVDYYDEKRDQIFSCCGVVPEGSLRVIQSGIIVDRLFKTEPTYQGITGTWTVRMVTSENYHSFLVLSFVEETRVLSVGLRFSDVTESVGFQSDVSTLACGLLNDGVLVQIHQRAVRLCLPTEAAHSNGVPLPSPVCTSWWPDNMTINLGAVSRDMIIVSTSNPSIIFILGARLCSPYKYEIFEMQQVRLQYELSCISIPQKCLERKLRNQSKDAAGDECLNSLLSSIDTGKSIIVGTHKPSVEILIFDQDGGLKVLANGTITVTNIMGTAISGCVPQDVRLVYIDRLYVLSGLRNGMLLRFEWPYATTASSSVCPHQSALSSLLGAAGPVLTSISALNTFGSSTDGTILSEKTWSRFPINLQLIAMRRIGITPVFLVPLSDSLDADIIALSDRPWLLHTDRHSLSYTSISYPSSTHATSVSCIECPNGILFVSENCLHLVEMVNSKRLNVQKFNIGGTPRKVVYHSDSRLLLMMRTELTYESCSSDICCVDPLSGIVLTSFKLERGEIGKSMDLVRVGNEQVLVVGTSLASRPAIMPSGEAESGKGRLIILSLQHVQNSDSGSMTICSKGGLSSQQALAVPEIGHNAEHLFSSSMCSSPDDNTSCDGIKIDETEAWELRVAYSAVWPGIVLAICPYLERYFLASASSGFYVCGFPNDTSQRVRKYSLARTRFMVTSLTAHFTRIAVGDCRDGVLFFSYDEDSRKLDPLYCDPSQRLVGDCILMDMDTAVVSDRKGSIAVLSSADHSEDNASPECNLAVSCAYYMGEISMSIKKGSFSYRLPVDSVLKGSNTKLEYVNNTIIASTLLGSVINFVPLSRREYELLEAVQARLVIHPLTAPILGNDHNEFRGRENPNGVPKILDGDMLTQFLELTSMQQEAILTLPLSTIDPVSLGTNFFPPPIPINQVVLLLERLHYALN